MNAFSRIAPAVIVLLTLIFFSSCYKIYDYVKQHPGAEVDICRVKLLIDGPDSVRIYYNAAGDPTDMIKNRPLDGTWQGDKHFRYDNHQRLTDFYYEMAGAKFRLLWHRYGYPTKSIVTDSLFAYINGVSGPNPPLENFSHLTIDSLDTDGRIVKSTEDPSYPNPFIVNYVYNAKGNIDAPFAVYDNKLNILKTNKAWMFLYNDYSVNNRLNKEGGGLVIGSYNQAGFPLSFSVAPGANHGSDIIFVTPGNLKVVYDCN